MGHYSTMKCNLKIKDKKSLRNLRSKISRFNRNQPENMTESKYLYLKEHLWYLAVKADLSLEWPDVLNEWYATDELAEFIKNYVTAGKIHFVDEGGYWWEYYFDGKGGLIYPNGSPSRDEELWELIRGKNGS